MDDQELDFETPKLTPAQAKTLKEMARMSNDRIRVYNPTDEDFIVRWDGGGFMVPSKNRDIGQGKGQAVHPRYICVKFVRELTDKILGGQRVAAILLENERRITTGMAKMNHFEDRVQFETMFREDNPEKRGKLIALLWLGIEEQYGLDVQMQGEDLQKKDPRSIDEQILANLEKPAKKLDDNALPSLEQQAPAPAMPQAPLNLAPQPAPQPPQEPNFPPPAAADLPQAPQNDVLKGLEA